MVLEAGKVYLVGAGPGSVAYLTLRGYELLRQAQALVYDALVDETLLTLVSATCELRYVGKRAGRPSMGQAEIDQLLVELCLQGLQVVRLKSGDPFIFGRTASEIQVLREAGCDFEVVPGVSSALAAPLLAGIPLTDPVLSRSFAVVTAHDLDALSWEALASIETLVILMGTRHLNSIVDRLIERGRSPQTPVAIICWAGHPQQQVWTGTLQTICQQTARQTLSPAVITIGEVVALRPFLMPPSMSENNLTPSLSSSSHYPLMPMVGSQSSIADLQPSKAKEQGVEDETRPTLMVDPHLPLRGKTVLITRAAGQSSQFSELLAAQGAKVLEMPAIEIVAPSSWQALDEAIQKIVLSAASRLQGVGAPSAFDWLILTSTNGVDHFFERLAAQGKDARAIAGIKIAVVGKKTAERLRRHGIQADFIPPNFVADSLVASFPENPSGLRLLFPRVETGGREVLVQEFVAKGASVTEVAAYQSGCAKTVPPNILTAIQQGTVDVITFASSKTVQCFCQLLRSVETGDGTDPSASLASLCIASIGPQTSATCHELLGRVDVEAKEFTLEGLTVAIAEYFESSEKLP